MPWPRKSLVSTVHFCPFHLCVSTTNVCTHWAITAENVCFSNTYLIWPYKRYVVQLSLNVLFNPFYYLNKTIRTLQNHTYRATETKAKSQMVKLMTLRIHTLLAYTVTWILTLQRLNFCQLSSSFSKYERNKSISLHGFKQCSKQKTSYFQF